jgi:hypothetical protein
VCLQHLSKIFTLRSSCCLLPPSSRHLGTNLALFFLIRWFIFLLLSFKIYFYKYFLPICNLSSHSLETQNRNFFILMKSSLSIISFMDCAFCVVSKSHHPIYQNIPGLFFCYLIGVLQFCTLHVNLLSILNKFL